MTSSGGPLGSPTMLRHASPSLASFVPASIAPSAPFGPSASIRSPRVVVPPAPEAPATPFVPPAPTTFAAPAAPPASIVPSGAVMPRCSLPAPPPPLPAGPPYCTHRLEKQLRPALHVPFG